MKKLFFFLFILLFLFVVWYAFQLTKTFIYNDISVENINPKCNPDFTAKEYKPRKPVYLVSYVDGAEIFYKNQNTLVLSALNRGFDFFLNYRKSLLAPKFYEENKEILTQRTGAGNWLWKPWVILHTLENSPENSFIIYSDVGFVFTNPIQPLVELANKHEIIYFRYEDPENPTTGRLGRVTQRKTLENMNCDTQECRNAELLFGGFQVYKNTQKSRAFVKQWLEACKIKENLVNTPSIKPEYPMYGSHNHDQSVLSVLRYQHPEGKLLLGTDDLYKYVNSHHRHPNKGKDYHSLLFEMEKKFRHLKNLFYNHKIMKGFREYLWNKEAKKIEGE